jgi:ribose 5-phosphate isomerase B
MKVIIGSDHAGYNVKEKLKEWFNLKGISYEDIGTNNPNIEDDYPDYAKKVAKLVSKDKKKKGILICGSGMGMTIAANKIKGIRAVSAYDEYSAKMARQDNNANILGLRGRYFPYNKTKKIVETFLLTQFSKKIRHKKRIQKIE